MLQENPLLEKAEGDDEPAPRGQARRAAPRRRPTDTPRARRRARRRRRAGSEARADARVDGADFEDYSGGDSDWGGGSGAPTTTTRASTRSRWRPPRCATTCSRSSRVLNLPLRDRQLVAALIDALDEDGYLHASLEELAEMFPEELEIEPDELSLALCYLQSFEPAGVGARDPAECLALQLKALPESTPCRAEALTVVTEHLPLLAARDFTKLKRLLHTDDAGVRAMRALVTSLNPAAGRRVREVRGELRHPRRHREEGAGQVGGRAERGGDAQAAAEPHLRRHPHAQPRLVEPAADRAAAGSQVADPQRRSSASRRSCGCRRRSSSGSAASSSTATSRCGRWCCARSPTMLDLHESTISRVTTQKYMLTPARHLRAQVFLRQPRRHRHRRRGLGDGDPGADQAADRRREHEDAADRQQDRGSPGRTGHHRGPAHGRQVPGGAADPSRQPAQGRRDRRALTRTRGELDEP